MKSNIYLTLLTLLIAQLSVAQSIGNAVSIDDTLFEGQPFNERINSLNRIGNVYFDQGIWDKALDYFSQALKIAREVNDLTGIARGLNNVAAVYANKGEYDNFVVNLREAILINKKTGRKLWEGINYLNMGINNRDRMNYDTALFYFKKSESIFSELNNLPKLMASYLSLSRYYSDKKILKKVCISG